MKKKYEKLMCYFLVFIMLFSYISPICGMFDVYAEGEIVNPEFPEVSSDKYKLTGLENLENNTLKVKVNESKVITLETEEAYRISSCHVVAGYYGANFADVTFNENTCKIDTYNYGKGYVNIEVSNFDYSSRQSVKFYIDSEAETYLNMVVDDIPSEIKNGDFWSYLKPGISTNDYYNTCTYEDNKQICNIEFKYCYSKIDSTEQECLSKPKEITFNNIYTNNGMLSTTYLSLNIGDTEEIYINNYDGKYEDLIWVSENNDIASVDQNGKITANGVGETLVKLYNKNTFEYEQVKINVKNPDDLMTIDEFVKSLENQKFELDINHENDVFSYQYNYDENGIYQIVPDYQGISQRYLMKMMNLNSLNNYGVTSTNCTDNICNATLSYWNGNSQELIEIKNIEFELKGLYITNPNYNLSVNYTFGIEYIKYLDTDSEVTLNYDENYIGKDEYGNYKAIKSGVTEIEIITEGYSDKVKIYIGYDENYRQELSNYMNNIKNITLPYSSLSLGSKSDLKYLESILENKIINDYPNEEIKTMLESEVTCLSANICNFKLYVKKDYTDLLGDSNISRIIKITYDESDTETINEIKSIDTLIKNTYLVDVDKVINLERTCSNDECFYDSLVNYTDLLNIKNNSNLEITYEKINTFDFKSLVKGGVKYLVKISKDNNVLFTKEIIVNSNHIVGMETSLDKNERSNYLKSYVDKLLGVETSNTLLYDNVYEVTVENKKFNLILDQKDAVEITQVDVIDRMFELTTGSSKQIKYKTWPFNGTVGNIEFVSDNEEIAKVDENGNITGVSKGYTFVDIKLGYTTNRVLVTVDMTVKEVLDSYLHIIDNNIIVEYSDLRNNLDNIELAIKNRISNKFYTNNYWLPLLADVKQENGKYYAAVAYNATNVYGANLVTSEYKEVTYEIKGIKFDEYKYDLSTNDVVNTNLFFSEGDNNNLYFSYDREGVAELNKDGTLKALKPGVTTIYVTDKYNKYYNYLTVTVNFDEFFESVRNSLETDKIKVNAIDFGRYNDFSNIVNNKLNERIPMYSLNRPTRFECNEETLECNYIILEDNAWDSDIYKELTFTVEKEGIYLDNLELELDIDEEKEISYNLINDNSQVKVESLNNDICKVENNKIKGISTGLCTVKYTSDKFLSYQHVLVGKDKIVNAYQTALALVNDELEVPLLDFDLNNHNFVNDEDILYNLYNIPIANKVKQIMNLDTDYSVWVGSEDGTFGENFDNMTVSVNPYYKFEDSKNNYYYYLDLTYNSGAEINKTIDIIPTEIDKNALEIGTKITEQTKGKYTLTMLQYLKLRLSGKTNGLLEYSDFYEMLKKECPTCTYEMGEGGMGDLGSGNISEGGSYVIFKDDNPIAILNLSFEASIDVLQSGEIFSEEEYINLLKEVVKDAYIKAKKELTGVSKMSTRDVKTARLDDEVVVNVTKEFDPEIMQNVYTVTVDDITFKTIANTETIGDINYTYSVTGLNVSESDITLNKGESKVIGYTITPDNATNKEVKFSSSDSNIVSVDSNGTIVAKGTGTAVITVTTVDGNMSKEIKVTVVDKGAVNVDVKLGDINVDGKINMSDLIKLRKYFAGIETLNSQGMKNADINKDGKVNMTDIIKLRKYFAGLEVL